MQEGWFRSRWYEFRMGHSTYLIFLLTFTNFILISYRFLSIKHALMTTIACLILVPLIYRISQSDLQVDSYNFDVEFRKVVIMRMDTIVYGVLAAYIKYYHGAIWKKSRFICFVMGILIIGIIATMILTKKTNSITNLFYKKL